ncbi:MAG: L-dopachrome tautomerase-related protein [Gammaproteobacteria bacterium]
MTTIFSRITKELASWIAICRFLRGLDRYGPNFTLGGEAKAITYLPPKHYKTHPRNGQNLKNLLLALCCLIAGNSAIAALTEQPYEIRARLDAAPGNITVTFDGRIITSLHQFYSPAYSVVELGEDGSLKPFPNAQFNDRTERTHDFRLDSVLGIRADSEGIVWMLDNGLRSQVVPKLVGWDSKHDKLHRVIELPPPATPPDAFVNDFAIDPKRNAIYIADPAGGSDAALIIVDLKTNRTRRVLQGHHSVIPEPVDLIIDGRPVQIKKEDGTIHRPRLGVNPITIDTKNEWVYFGPMSGMSLYRVRAEDLANEQLNEILLADRVQRYSSKPICDGISIDKSNNIYLGDLAANAIGVITPDRKYIRLVQSSDLSWDSFSFGPQGELYAVVNRLHRSAVLNAGEALSKTPYFVLRVKAYDNGVPGR